MSDSARNINFYRLLQAYLTVLEYREKTNAVFEDAHAFSFAKNIKARE